MAIGLSCDQLASLLQPSVTKGTIPKPTICGNTTAADVACNLLHLPRASWSFLTMRWGPILPRGIQDWGSGGITG